MGVKNEEVLRMRFKVGDVIDVKWLLNHEHLTQAEIEQLVADDVLTVLKKDPNDFMSDDRYRLNKERK